MIPPNFAGGVATEPERVYRSIVADTNGRKDLNMSKKTAAKKTRATMPTTTAEGTAMVKKYYNGMALIDGKPGGYASFDEFVWLYLAPMGVNRLAALDRYKAKA